jgi:tRNA U34 5-carboxymethylaminomethyl modifying enzyme MnmG/GidA
MRPTTFYSGMKRFPAGRLGDAPSVGLSASLNAAGFKLGRLQTGTPARLDRSTINFSNLPRQEGDATPSPFSYLNDVVDNAVSFYPTCCLPKSVLISWIGQSSFLFPDADDPPNAPGRQR